MFTGELVLLVNLPEGSKRRLFLPANDFRYRCSSAHTGRLDPNKRYLPRFKPRVDVGLQITIVTIVRIEWVCVDNDDDHLLYPHEACLFSNAEFTHLKLSKENWEGIVRFKFFLFFLFLPSFFLLFSSFAIFTILHFLPDCSGKFESKSMRPVF